MLANYSTQLLETDMSRYKLLTPPAPIIQEKKGINTGDSLKKPYIRPPSDGLIMVVCLIVLILYVCVFLTKVPR